MSRGAGEYRKSKASQEIGLVGTGLRERAGTAESTEITERAVKAVSTVQSERANVLGSTAERERK